MPVQANMSTWRLPHWSELYFYLLAPTVVFAARVNQALFEFPSTTLVFDTVTVGAFGDIKNGMTMLLGSTAGASDLGRIRVKSATSNTLTLAKYSRGVFNGELNPTDNAYITILDLYEVHSKIPYINPSDGVQYKDTDVAFSVNGSRKPVANIEWEYDGDIFVDSVTGEVTVNVDGTTSYPTAESATLTGYAWDFEDGTPSSSTNDTETVTFPAGKRWISLTVTDSNSQTHTMRVFIPAMERTGSNAPLTQFEIASHGIRAEGQSLSVKIYSSIPASTYPDGTLAILFAKEHYGNTTADLTASSGCFKPVFYGWHVEHDEDVQGTDKGIRTNAVLNFADAAGMLKLRPGFPIEISHTEGTATTWSEYNRVDIDKYIHHILQWHSTVLDVANFVWSETNVIYQFTRLGSDGATLWEQARARVEAIAWKLTCDTHNTIRMVLNQQLTYTSGAPFAILDRTTTEIAALTGADIARLDYGTRYAQPYHWGNEDSIAAGNAIYTPFFAVSPGTTPGQGAAPYNQGNQLALTQTELNIRAGHRYANQNAVRKDFDLKLVHNGNAGIEPAFGEWIDITLTAAQAAERGFSFTNARFLINEVTVSYTGPTKQVERDYKIEIETSGTPAQTIDVEAGTGTYTVPANNALPDLSGALAGFNSDGFLYVTNNFNALEPDWTAIDLTGTVVGVVQQFIADPFTSGEGWLVTTGTGTNRVRVYHITDIFGTPAASLVFTSSAAPVNTPARIHASRGFQNRVMVAFWMATGCYVARTVDNVTWTETQVVANVNTSPDSAETLGIFYSDKTSGKAYCGGFSVNGADDAAAGKIYVSLDDGATWGLSTSPDGAFLSDGGNAFLVPYNDNPVEAIVYARRYPSGGAPDLVRIEGATQTDVSPNGNTGPVTSPYPISASPLNRNLMVCSVFDASLDIAIFKTTSGGVAGWERVTEFTDFTSAGVFWNCELVDNNRCILWGDDAVGVTLDFFSTPIQSRLGNLPTSGIYFAGICRGA